MAHVARTDAAHTLDVTLEERLTVMLKHERRIYLPLMLRTNWAGEQDRVRVTPAPLLPVMERRT